MDPIHLGLGPSADFRIASILKRAGPLQTYRQKRDFTRTPEPAPSAKRPRASGKSRIFMVHKHHARRLHYDLRLETEGVLASWAIPKGPIYDPTIRRLAIETEDHPLEYGEFEGRIPEGEYGAGDSLIWDRGTFATVPPATFAAQRAKGHIHLELAGQKLQGGWHLVRTGKTKGPKSQWLFFKAKDALARPDGDITEERPESVASGKSTTRGPRSANPRRLSPEQLLERLEPPMLATLVKAVSGTLEDWILEVKYDGFRALGALVEGRVALWSRNSEDLSERFPTVAPTLASLPPSQVVLDGEIVAVDPKGIPHFELLQRGQGKIKFMVFDLLWLEGEDVRHLPLEQRRELLEHLLVRAPAGIELSERVSGSAETALAKVARRGYEGLVAKRRGSVYENRRSTSWLKLKALSASELAIVGFTTAKGTTDQMGALLLGVQENGRLRYAGRVGTGFSQKDRHRLFEELRADKVAEPPVSDAPRSKEARWVRPRLVAQVRFTEWTKDGLLRHPVFAGLRDDKQPSECVREEPVTAIASSSPRAPAETIKLTHPDRVLYPKEGITKAEVAEYYAALAGPLLAVLSQRPTAFEHFPKGTGAPSWFAQHVKPGTPSWIPIGETPSRERGGENIRRIIVDRPETLRFLAQQAVLTIHVSSARLDNLQAPDWVVFDLDPADGESIGQAVEVAGLLRRLFEQLGLPSVPKTSGKRGLHILIPLASGHTHEQAVQFALGVGNAISRITPKVTLERSRSNRKGRLYLDCLQNGYGKLIVAPYSLRGVDGAPVSTPLAWSEVTRRLDPGRYTLRTLPARLAKVGDLFAPVLSKGIQLPKIR